MSFDDFIGRIRSQARLTQAEAFDATRATLNTVGERIGSDAALRLAIQLPREIGGLLEEKSGARRERLSFGEFCQRVAIREDSNVPDAITHARCVIETVEEAVNPDHTPDHTREIFSELHRDFAPLFY